MSVYLVSKATNFFFDTQDVANNAKIVTIFADGGWKYLSSGIYEKKFSEISDQINGKTWW